MRTSRAQKQAKLFVYWRPYPWENLNPHFFLSDITKICDTLFWLWRWLPRTLLCIHGYRQQRMAGNAKSLNFCDSQTVPKWLFPPRFLGKTRFYLQTSKCYTGRSYIIKNKGKLTGGQGVKLWKWQGAAEGDWERLSITTSFQQGP